MNFDARLQMDKGRQGETKLATPVKTHARRRCKYFGVGRSVKM